jgi:DNA-directed RNA polymerase subunit omega
MKLVEGFDSNYRYVLVAARRARQIQNGARPSVEPHSHKPCRIAEEELQAGKVKWEIPTPGSAASLEAIADVQSERVGGEADD